MGLVDFLDSKRKVAIIAIGSREINGLSKSRRAYFLRVSSDTSSINPISIASSLDISSPNFFFMRRKMFLSVAKYSSHLNPFGTK
jgi:hypothetical protein